MICHYLATGRRVLVTSKGEPATEVLRQKLPEGIRELTVCPGSESKQGPPRHLPRLACFADIVFGRRSGRSTAVQKLPLGPSQREAAFPTQQHLRSTQYSRTYRSEAYVDCLQVSLGSGDAASFRRLEGAVEHLADNVAAASPIELRSVRPCHGESKVK